MLPIVLIQSAMGRGAVVTLSGENIATVDGVTPYNSQCGIRINTDGTIDSMKILNGGAKVYTQLAAPTDWIAPNAAATSVYEVRVTSVTGTFDAAAAADDVWIAISSNREWSIVKTDAGIETVDFDVEIRYASGAALAAGTYQIHIENTA